MECLECGHENTEGAWLCINCGGKLPRPEDGEPAPDQEKSEPEDPGRFAPKISENLRRLREQTERERSASERRPPSTSATPSTGSLLGLPLWMWAVVAVIAVAFVMLVSNFQ